MLKANELGKGKVISHEGELYSVHEARHVAKGNKRSYMQCKLRHLIDGRMLDVRFNVDDRVETPFVETRNYEFLYRDGQDYVLMDQENYEQLHVPGDAMGDAHYYLKGNEPVQASIINGKIVSVDLPNVVELKITDTTPPIKGATVTNQNKDATCETGLRIKVPPFIENGEMVRVDTRSGEYIERAK